MDVHWENTVGKIINEADKEWRDKYVGKTFKYIHLDSWEGGDPMSSPLMADEFKARRGYEMGSKSGPRYKEDFDLTRTELWVDFYYGRLSEKSHALNMQTHCAAGDHLFQNIIIWEICSEIVALRILQWESFGPEKIMTLFDFIITTQRQVI